jgi:hypothetical protein
MANTDKAKLAGELMNTIGAGAGGNYRRGRDIGEHDSAKSNRRQHPRYFKPTLGVAFGHKPYPTRDWSLGGVCVAGVQSGVAPNSTVALTLVIGHLQFPATGQVRRYVAEARELALEFKGLPRATADVLTRLKR